MKRLTKEEADKLWATSDNFREYESFDEYFDDVVMCLVYSTWHEYSTEEKARARAEEDRSYIEKCYRDKVQVADCAADVGYSCG